jgi:hypothetical protein
VNYQEIYDNYLPVTTIPSLQSVDNYQIYTLISTDFSPTKKHKNFLAVQSFSTTPILCDFVAIAKMYK